MHKDLDCILNLCKFKWYVECLLGTFSSYNYTPHIRKIDKFCSRSMVLYQKELIIG